MLITKSRSSARIRDVGTKQSLQSLAQVESKVYDQEEFDQRREQLDAANAAGEAASGKCLPSAGRSRSAAQPAEGASLTDVPAHLDETFSSVREVLGELMQSAAQLGVVASSWDMTPKQVVEEVYGRDPSGDINKIYTEIPRLRWA